jgi:hypothetical protein
LVKEQRSAFDYMSSNSFNSPKRLSPNSDYGNFFKKNSPKGGRNGFGENKSDSPDRTLTKSIKSSNFFVSGKKGDRLVNKSRKKLLKYGMSKNTLKYILDREHINPYKISLTGGN